MVDRYALFGNPVEHSPSPFVHALFAQETQESLTYGAIRVPLNGFAEALKHFQQQGGKGLNVTLPFKEEAYHLCDQLSPRAQCAGAVNTIKIGDDGKLYGDNTDGYGLICDIVKNHHFPIREKKVLLLGASGAARGAIKPILDQNPISLLIANRTRSKALELAEAFMSYGPVTGSGLEELKGRFDLIINATSASLRGERLPLPDGIIGKEGCCYDMVYSAESTPFLEWAKDQGVKRTLDGVGMLIEQAAESFYLWRDVRPDTALMRGSSGRHVRKKLKEMLRQNQK